MAMAPGRLRTPGKRVHSEPTRRPIVRSGALELAGAKRSIRGSLLRSTNSERERGRACCLLGESAPPSAAGPLLPPVRSRGQGLGNLRCSLVAYHGLWSYLEHFCLY